MAFGPWNDALPRGEWIEEDLPLKATSKRTGEQTDKQTEIDPGKAVIVFAWDTSPLGNNKHPLRLVSFTTAVFVVAAGALVLTSLPAAAYNC